MYKGTLIAVKNMDESKRFYHDILGINVVADFGANVQLDNGLFLQTINTWSKFINNKGICLKNNASELYFEEVDIDEFFTKLKAARIEYVHEPLEYSWGQRAVCFYDPDHHIIEVAEDIVMVVKRFCNSGLSEEEVAVRMDVPVDYVKECMKSYLEMPEYKNASLTDSVVKGEKMLKGRIPPIHCFLRRDRCGKDFSSRMPA